MRNVGRTVTLIATQYVMLALVGGSPIAEAQTPGTPTRQVQETSAWFPAQRYFTSPLADPGAVRLAAGLYSTDVFDPRTPAQERPPFSFSDPDAMRRDVHGAVTLGGTLPLWRAQEESDRGLLIGVQAGVHARFRIQSPTRDYAASDWTVAFPLEAYRGRASARLRLLHRSSHLGDELIEATGVRRIAYGHEAFDLLAAYRVWPELRLYGGGTWVFRSNTANDPNLHVRGVRVSDRAVVQLGADGEWYRWADGRVGIIAGIDWQSAQRTEWNGQLAAIAGVSARGEAGGLRLIVRYFDGASALGEFFLTDEQYWGLEVVAEL